MQRERCQRDGFSLSMCGTFMVKTVFGWNFSEAWRQYKFAFAGNVSGIPM